MRQRLNMLDICRTYYFSSAMHMKLQGEIEDNP